MSTWLTNNSAAESLFRALFEHNPAVVLGIDLEHRIADVNPAGLRISGYTREELVAHTVTDFVPPSQRDRVRGFLNQAMRGETLTFRVSAYASDGSVIEYDATLLPVLTNNTVAGAYALLENITERMHAERTVAAQREELMDLEHDFRSLFERNPDGIIFLTTDGVIVDLNNATLQMGGRKREEVVGQNFRVFLQGSSLERGWNYFRRAVAGEAVRFEIGSSRADGSELILDVTLFPKYAQGLVVGVYCVLQDITDRKIAQRRLEMQTQRVRDLYLLATTPEYSDAQVMTTLQTGCRLLGMESGAIVDVTGEPRVELRYDALELFSGDDGKVLEIGQAVLAHREPVVSQLSEEPSEGGCRSWIGSRLMVGGVLHGALLFFSSTRREHDFEEIDHDTLALMAALVGSALERRRTRSRLRTLAYYDSLTGLPNRLFFQERLRDALIDPKGTPQHLAVLFFDLDRFKDINDTLGHAMGDRFLQMVAHRLVDMVGNDGMVARMGGDEFIVLAPGYGDSDSAASLAQSLLHAIEEPYRLDGYEQFMTSSVGVSLYPTHGRDDQTLIKNADMAMYHAKDRGGNAYFFYDESLEAPMRTRLAQEKDLRRAIQRKQFVLHYQPIVDVASDRIVAVETLVRWNDPRRRALTFPDEFIPTAEATGLIVQLGEWIIASAAAQTRAWHERLGPLTLAVNISARQFHQPNLGDRLLEILRASGLPPSSVELEITESMALSDVSQAIETLQQLKAIGVKIAVDDFGTGHSSLSYLRRFDVDYIKIDRSFVAGIGTESSDETIVKAIIAMGHSLGLTVVAEGVETQAQYDFLRAHRCDRVQGYLISRPVDAAALEALVVERGTRAVPG
jgi:diguanylate cyclase (GGDEF)-like protein/PAS domain S-box-containing protein